MAGNSPQSVFAQVRKPLVFLRQTTGQPKACLEGLVRYAWRIAATDRAREFGDLELLLWWLWSQPVKLDYGAGRKELGCIPAQRSELWPEGLNCWEATGHFLGVALRNAWPLEIYLFDALVNGQRHVFPAVRPLGSEDSVQPLVLQPPVRTGKSALGLSGALSQAWYNDLLGGVHLVGDTVLKAFGAGKVGEWMADVEGDALPDWARTAEQRDKRQAAIAKQAIANSKATPPPPKAPSSKPAPTPAPTPEPMPAPPGFPGGPPTDNPQLQQGVT